MNKPCMLDCEITVKTCIGCSEFCNDPKLIILFLEKIKTDYIIEMIKEMIIKNDFY